MPRTRIIGVRVDKTESKQFERAAKSENKNVSEWLRDLGVAALRPPPKAGQRVLHAGIKVGSGGEIERYPAPPPTINEIAASIPGVRVGVDYGGNPVEEFEGIHVGDAPVEDIPVRPWLPELIRLQKLGEADPNSAADEFETLIRGVRLPKAFRSWSLHQRGLWLESNAPLEIA